MNWMKINWNLTSLWSIVSVTAAASLWVFTNIAWASDVSRIEARLIKSDLRELRKELSVVQSDEAKRLIREDIEDAIDALCRADPNDRECKK